MKLQRLVILLTILGCSVAKINAQTWEGIIQPSSLQTSASLTVYEDEIDYSSPPTVAWQPGYVPGDHNVFKAKGTVKLYVDKTAKLNITSRLEYQFNLAVDYMDANLNSSTDNIALTVEYDPASGTSYQDIELKQYEDVHWMKISVISITDLVNASTVTDVEDLFKLSGVVEIDRFKDFDPLDDIAPASLTCDFDCNVFPTCPSACDFINVTPATIEFTLPSYSGAEFFDVEWTWIDPNGRDANGALVVSGLDVLTFSFENNASRVRVSTDRTSYTIANTFREGYIAFRYRAIGRESTTSHYVYSSWLPKGKSTGSILGNDYTSAFIEQIGNLDAHEVDKNWQFVTTFAEDGKRKEVITYYDGLNKNRQAVTQLPSDGTTIVGQTVYDHEGRPAVQVLPVPIEDKADLQYEPNVNPASGGQQYSADNFDGKSTPDPLATDALNSDGASRYYSPNNGFNQSHNDYIPDAQGYPFTQTVYTQDQTGRIQFQSGVGDNHRIGSGHETEYKYGKPNPVDIAALFGDEMGKHSHYKESIVIDPNGQMSVSYIDQHGRVIATSLSGADINGLENLTSAITNNVQDVHPMHLANNMRMPKAHPTSYELTYTHVAKKTGAHQFWYEFQPEDYVLSCNGICFDCHYKLTISVVDGDGNVIVDEEKTFDPSGGVDATCDPNSVLIMWDTYGSSIDNSTFERILSAGTTYHINKKLELLTTNIDAYWQLYLEDENSCLKNYAYFYGFAYDQTTPCDDLYDEPEDPGSAQCNTFRSMMLADFTPGGQYAVTLNKKDADGIYLDQRWFISIFNEDNHLDDFDNVFWGSFDEAVWNAPFSEYVDEEGDRTKVQEGASNWVYPEEYSKYEVLADNWKSSYSESLFKFHPEYPYYHLMCELPEFDATFDYDEQLLNTETMAEAISAGYIDPSDANAIVDIDPIILDLDYAFWDAVTKDNAISSGTWASWYDSNVKDVFNTIINNYDYENDDEDPAVATYYTIRELTAKIHCKQSRTDDYLGSWSCEDLTGASFNNSNTYTTEELDEQWVIYRNLYLGRKNEQLVKVINNLVNAFYVNPASNPYTNRKIGKFNVGSNIFFIPAKPHFSVDNLFNLEVTDNDNNDLDLKKEPGDDEYEDLESDMKEVYDNELEARASSLCEQHVTQWMSRINNCPYLTIANGKTLAQLSEDLTNVCMNSYNPNRLMGGREDDADRPDIVTTSFSSIQEVLEDYFDEDYETTYCNLDVFDDEMVMNDHALTIEELKNDKDCSCEYLENLVVETIEEQREITSVKTNCNENWDWIENILNDLVATSPTIGDGSYNNYVVLNPASAAWTYNSTFATQINVDIALNPTDRIEYIINDYDDPLTITFRKQGASFGDDQVTVTLFNWPAGPSFPSGTFTNAKSDLTYSRCLSCVPFGITFNGNYYAGQLSASISTCGLTTFKKVVEEVSSKMYYLEGTTLTNGEVLMLIQSCDNTKKLLGALDMEEDGDNCAKYMYFPSLVQEIMIDHLDEVSKRTGPELGASVNAEAHNCLPGPYNYCPANDYQVYKRSLIVNYHPYNNYLYSTSYDLHEYDVTPAQTSSSLFFFGSRFKTYCSDAGTVRHCFASLAYFDAADAANPIANRGDVKKVEGPYYDYDNQLWTAKLTIDDGVSPPYERFMHFISCNSGNAFCVELDWLDLTYKGSCAQGGNFEATEDFDFLCDCDEPKFDEFFDELMANGKLFGKVTETDVSTYTAVNTNESINNLQLYNTSSGDYEWIVIEETGTEMKASFGDLSSDYCNLYVQVPEGAAFTLNEIVSFDETRLNSEMMDQEANEGVANLRYGSGHYLIDVTLVDPVENPIAPHYVTRQIELYSNCYITACAVFNTKKPVIPARIKEKLPCPECVDCKDLKEEVEQFVSLNPKIGYNHTLFPTLFTRYLNSAFNTNRAYSEYVEFMGNCKISTGNLPVHTECHLSFEINEVPVENVASAFNVNFTQLVTDFEASHSDFVKYSTEDNGSKYKFCFNFDNLSPEDAGELMNALTKLVVNGGGAKGWANYPIQSTGYPNAEENTLMNDLHRIEIPNTIASSYTTQLNDLVNNHNVVVTVGSGVLSKSYNGDAFVDYKEVLVDVSNLTTGKEHQDLVDDLLGVLNTTNEAIITLNRLNIAYLNMRHSSYNICEPVTSTCETCDDIRDVVLDYVYNMTEVPSNKQYTQDLERAIEEEFGYAVTASRKVDECETCTDKDLYICEEISTEAIDLLEWINSMATSVTGPSSLSANTDFLNAGFYPNLGSDNPAYSPSLSAANNELTMTVTDNEGFSMKVVIYTANREAIDFDKITSFEKMNLIPDARGANYHFKVFGHNTLDDEIYILEGHVDAFAIAACCYFDDLELCYRPQMPVVEWEPEDCDEYRHRIATLYAEDMYQEYLDVQRGLFEEEYREACATAFTNGMEKFEMKALNVSHHYTLYYYDLAGNLTQTVPPKGVTKLNSVDATNIAYRTDPMTGASYPSHNLNTFYQYNSLNQPIWQSTPDGGKTNFFYDKLGRVVFTQNARQANELGNLYAYKIYDAISRVIESGEINLANAIVQSNFYSNSTYHADLLSNTTWKREVTYVKYDESYSATVSSEFGLNGQENLRNRVATTYYKLDAGNTNDYDYATHYSYDVYGSVKTVIQEYPELASLGDSYKRIDYEYDQVSGNVNEVYYQKDQADQFIHRYSYSSDNRIESVETSRDGVIWDVDAGYRYYLHGPMARTELGDNDVQGLDYAYTLQGWMKGVNAVTLEASRDPGDDAGDAFARDAIGFNLHYYDGDYQSIGTTSFLPEKGAGANEYGENELFNGNISAMTTANRALVNEGKGILGQNFKYDQLNRLVESESFLMGATGMTANSWSGITTANKWSTEYSYDANGNLETLFRRGHKSLPVMMDKLIYHYENGTNQLRAVEDDAHTMSGVSTAVQDAYFSESDGGVEDIDYGQDVMGGNYFYDETGRLIQDDQEEIDAIEWTLHNKVKSVSRSSGSVKADLEFEYGPAGQRVKKLVKNTGREMDWSTQYYVHDANGQVMAIYNKSLSIEDAVLNYEAIGDWVEAYNSGGTQAVVDLLKVGYAQHDEFKDRLVTELINSGLKQTVASNYTLTQLLTWEPELAKDIFTSYDNGPVDFDFMLEAMINNTTFKNDFIDGVWSTHGVMVLETLLANDPANDYLNCFSLTALNQFVADIYMGPSPIPTFGTKLDAINHLKANHTDNEIALNLYTLRGVTSKSKLKNCATNLLLTSTWTHNNLLLTMGSLSTFFDDVVASLDVDDLATWFISDPDPVPNRAYNYLLQNGNDNLMVGAIAANDGANFIDYGLNAIPDFTVVYSTLLLGLEDHSSIDLAFLVKQELGDSVYNSMMDDLADDFEYTEVLKLVDLPIYGFKRHGSKQEDLVLIEQEFTVNGVNGDGTLDRNSATTIGTALAPNTFTTFERTLGEKLYELSNHLGNVLVSVSDRRVLTEDISDPDPANWWWDADVISAQDYYPFGMRMPDRIYENENTKNYRYGFNGQERDDEWNGAGNSYDFGARIYDSRIGKFLSVDPKFGQFPDQSPYVFAANNPMAFVDNNGENPVPVGKLSAEDLAVVFNAFNSAILESAYNSGREDGINYTGLETEVDNSVSWKSAEKTTDKGHVLQKSENSMVIELPSGEKLQANVQFRRSEYEGMNTVTNVEQSGLITPLLEKSPGYGFTLKGKNGRLIGYLAFEKKEDYDKYVEYTEGMYCEGKLDGIEEGSETQGYGDYYPDYYKKKDPDAEKKHEGEVKAYHDDGEEIEVKENVEKKVE